MPHLGVVQFLPFVLLAAFSGVVAKDLSKYPCTVYGAAVCFRLPVGTRLEYSVPADFDLYSVAKGSDTIAKIYIGSAPQVVESSAPPRVSRSGKGTIKIYGEPVRSTGRLDIYIVPKARNASIIHVSAAPGHGSSNELKELLSSFRPCKPIRSGGQKCPIDTVWSKELVRELQGAEDSASQR